MSLCPLNLSSPMALYWFLCLSMPSVRLLSVPFCFQPLVLSAHLCTNHSNCTRLVNDDDLLQYLMNQLNSEAWQISRLLATYLTQPELPVLSGVKAQFYHALHLYLQVTSSRLGKKLEKPVKITNKEVWDTVLSSLNDITVGEEINHPDKQCCRVCEITSGYLSFRRVMKISLTCSNLSQPTDAHTTYILEIDSQQIPLRTVIDDASPIYLVTGPKGITPSLSATSSGSPNLLSSGSIIATASSAPSPQPSSDAMNTPARQAPLSRTISDPALAIKLSNDLTLSPTATLAYVFSTFLGTKCTFDLKASDRKFKYGDVGMLT